MPATDELKAQIVLAAASAVGPADALPADGPSWGASVALKSAEIAALALNERSAAIAAVNGVLNSKVFAATILDVSKEQSSTRGLVKLKTKPSKFHEDGIEQARTERTDNEVGRAMARRLRSLTGHRVLIYIEVEQISGGASTVRVIRHVEDLGPDTRSED